jgi:hypothetical protein
MTRTASPMPDHLQRLQWIVAGQRCASWELDRAHAIGIAILCVSSAGAVPASRAGLTRVPILVQRGVLRQPALARAHPCISTG